MRYKGVSCVALGALLSCFSAGAQTFGEFTGRVADSTGAVIAGAKVTITNVATNVSRVTETNESGNYTVPFVSPGVYDLQAETEGFKTALQEDWTLQVGDVARVDFSLEIGVVTEVIEVEAGAQMLQTSSTALGAVIEQRRIVDLPINGRNYLNLVKLSTNVSAEMGSGGQANSRQGGERANQPISVSGQRQQYNRFTLDGIENTDPNFNTFVVRPSVDALQEFKVQTGVYSAEFGKSTAQINVTTRAGTNEFHGTVFEFLRNDAIQARPWLREGDKNPFRRNQFGFTVAGPVLKNKLFFMANYEAFRQRIQRIRRTTVADAAMRGGDFSNPNLFPIYDPDTIRDDAAGGTAAPFPNRRVPQARFKQPFVQMFEFYPEPNVANAVVGGTNPAWNYVRNAPDPLDWDQFTSRIDFSESDASQWFGRLSWGDERLTSGQNFEFRDLRTTTKVYQFMLSNTRTISPTLVNELRLGANLFDNDRLTYHNGIRDVTAELGIPGLDSPIEAAWGSPQISFNGNNEVAGWGEQTGGPFINRNRTYQIVNNTSWIRGTHSIRFGGDIVNRRYNQIGNQFPRGHFEFPSQYTADPSALTRTGDAFATGLLGWTRQATRAPGIANVQFRSTALSLYIEDSWKVTPKLTVNLGLRYELTPPFSDRYRGIMNVQLFCPGATERVLDPSCQTPVLVRPGEGDFHEGLGFRIADAVPKATGDDVLHNHATQVLDRNDFAPRFGVAYRFDDKTTVRTGYGIYYAQDTGNPVFDMGRNFGVRQTARSQDLFPLDNLDDPWANQRSSGCGDYTGPCFVRLYTFANDANRRTPYVHQYLFNIQRQVTDSLLLEVGYSGSAGHKLQRMYGFNTPIERSGPLDRTSTRERRPFGDVFGRIQTIGNVVNSNYNALGVKVQQRFSKGLTYLIGYTWAKSIDNGSAIRTNSGDVLFPTNNYNLRKERGLSQFNTPHRFTASILYQIPTKFSSRALETIVGGWQLGSIVTLSTGTPIYGGHCSDLNGTGQNNRGDSTGDPHAANPTPQEFWKKNADGRAATIACNVPDSAGFNQLTYRDGDRGRNTLQRPGFRNWDFSVMKDFALTEKYRLQFRFESFNFANHPNWNNPNSNPRSRNFGVITSAREMRTNQFALKLIF